MQQRTIEIAVGVFVIGAILSLLMLAIRVSGLSDVVDTRDGFYITADFNNIGGLKVRSRVSIGGVPIGRVTNIHMEKDEFLARVTMMLYSEYDTIPDDSEAAILTAGLLGDNYVGITPGFSDEFLEAESHLDVANTNSAVILEELISKFVAGQASK